MTTSFVLLAHPDPRSFNASWATVTRRSLTEMGHDVHWSDLWAMGFDPVERPEHHLARDPAVPFDVLKVQEASSKAGALPDDVTGEIAKLEASDRLILHFPLWWFAPPAILKGWCERVLVHGGLHSTAARFDSGRFRGKKVLFCVTTGSSAAQSAPDGKEGDVRMLLWPLAFTFRYLGFTVLEPRVLHGVHGYHKGPDAARLDNRLSMALADHPHILARFDDLPSLAFNSDADFDADGRLKPAAPSHSPFIRHDVPSGDGALGLRPGADG